MTIAIKPKADSLDWFERLCAKRGWVIVDGIAWIRHVDEHARWFGANAERVMPRKARAA
jgi:hypothetical protein